jgi:hypothetical protein
MSREVAITAPLPPHTSPEPSQFRPLSSFLLVSQFRPLSSFLLVSELLLELGQDAVLVQPRQQGSLHVRVGERWVAVTRVRQRQPQEAHLVRRRREKRLEESGLVVVSDVAKGQRQPQIERVGELVPGEIRFHEADELPGEVGLLVRPFPLRFRKVVGGEIVKRPEHCVLPSDVTALERADRSGLSQSLKKLELDSVGRA